MKIHIIDSQAATPQNNSHPETGSKGHDLALLVSNCSFLELFQHNTAGFRPASEVAYSRSDYDGRRWWTTWHQCQKERPTLDVAHEIDAFQNALFSLPELQSLTTMKQLCEQAEATNEPTEFNLYSETEHFHIWLRLITRFRDYNVYVHYYLKG